MTQTDIYQAIQEKLVARSVGITMATSTVNNMTVNPKRDL
ncbi:MAG: hypothetical protein ACI9T7_002233 [Oleiphilaceae bacterium]|jgi:hypothetical protein